MQMYCVGSKLSRNHRERLEIIFLQHFSKSIVLQHELGGECNLTYVESSHLLNFQVKEL